MRTTRNIAARAGRWSAQHRKIAIFGWLAFVIVAVLIGKAIGTNHLGSSQTSRTGESGRADAVLRSTFQRNYSEQVLVQARTGRRREGRLPVASATWSSDSGPRATRRTSARRSRPATPVSSPRAGARRS